MQLNKIFDPRDQLQKTRRKDIERYARENNLSFIKEGMPQLLMVKRLRQHGITSIPAPQHTLGFSESPSDEPSVSINADDLLEAEWADEPKEQFNESTPFPILKKACKERGIKTKRTDKKSDLLRLLNGDSA